MNSIFFMYLDFPQQIQALGNQQWSSELVRQVLYEVMISI